MAQEISLFSGYEQSENRTANYCLLILRMLYEEGPKLLAEALAAIAGDAVAESVGVRFRQQQKMDRTVPDGLIVQKPFNVFIETKRFDWFYDRQLEGHIEALDDRVDELDRAEPGLKVMLALSNFGTKDEQDFHAIKDLCENQYGGRIVFRAIGFEEFYDALPRDRVSPNLANLILEFRAYLDAAGLLPRWRYLLDVVNCANSFRVILEGNAYICPAAGGPYEHRRSKYFGMYRDKRVSLVAHIVAVVDLDERPGGTKVKWRNVDDPGPDLIARAKKVHEQFDKGLIPARVFLLEDAVETDFLKSAKGGLFGAKKYFDIEHLHATDAADLARKLRGQTWEGLQAFVPDA